MTDTTTRPSTTSSATQFGYLVAIVVNGLLLFAFNNIGEWDLLPFLTEELDQLLWLINLSLGASIMVNAVYLSYDPDWFKSMSQIGLNLIALIVTWNIYRVFPFDFAPYDFNWELATRVVLGVAMFGTATASIVEFVKLIRLGVGTGASHSHQPQT